MSSQQQSILRWLLAETQTAERSQSARLENGIPWVPQIANKAAENSRRASLCRALKRLEGRGLINRIRGRKQARTIRVKLTPEGRRVAEAGAAY